MINKELLSFRNIFTIGLIIILVNFVIKWLSPKLDGGE